MASPSSFSAEDAEASIQRHGAYSVQDRVVGDWVNHFRGSQFPIKSPRGLEFVARNSLDRQVSLLNLPVALGQRIYAAQDTRALLQSMLGRPYWGLIKIYSDVLPSDYAWRFHNGSDDKPHTILLQLWGPGSSVVFYDGSPTRYIEDVDKHMSEKWGLLATKRSYMHGKGMEENIVELKEGGLVLSDSRLSFTILKGYTIDIGFTTPQELGFWAKMRFPYSQELHKKIKELEGRGFDINYTWAEPEANP
ncbi:hypothetical protein S7711_10780 [Stachybotrys chartarum IBT 7711]|uniref:Uncharacterized protein n=1 Tax=Stachybotrys chartarum (strain CBS 109288 / IBT 7711) TaxID=1280523 RepID=A0A084AHT2_STACB|nr:hypothetical protein S7711_10780 [Stachybotrys chartarum IBT 7711]